MRFVRYIGVLAALTTLLGVANARLTGTNPSGSQADVWCVGQRANEVCVDYLGNVIPTQTLDSSLGTSSLYWNSAYVNSLAVSGNLIRAAYSQAVTSGAVIKAASACGGLMLLSASGNVTADANVTLDTASASNTGCVVSIVNLGGGIITLNTLSNFKTKGYPSLGAIALGTNNAIHIAQTGSYWVLIGTVVVN